MRVKSLITRPEAGAHLPTGPQRIEGFAWSGDAPIARVEVSVEGEGEWHPARLLEPSARHTWHRWEWEWTPSRAGRHALRARATDAAGNTQPDIAVWNRHGYVNNAVKCLVVEVEH
jgi:hypothetical protein